MADIEVTENRLGGGYLIRILVDEVNRHVLDEIVEKAPKIVAEQYVKVHMQEIMEKISATEISSCIAAAVAQKVAEAYKPKETSNVDQR